MLNSTLWDYNVAYIFAKRTITVANPTVAAAATSNLNNKVMFKNCASFTDSMSENEQCTSRLC